MTEIEMDIDVAKPGLDGHIEDDIIDFDTDMVDSNQDLQKHDDNLEVVDREMQEDDDTADHNAYETNRMMSEDVDFDLHDAEDTVNNPEEVDYEVSEAPELRKHEPDQAAQPSTKDAQKHEDDVENVNETDAHGHGATDDHTSQHEIDYEFEDHAEPDESHQDVNADATSHLTEPGADQAASAAVDHDGHQVGDNITAPEQDVPEHTEEEKDILSHESNHEPQHQEEAVSERDTTTFGEAETEADEHEHEHVEAPEEDVTTHEEEYAAENDDATALETELDHEVFEGAEHTEDNGYDKGEDGPNEYNEDEVAVPEHADHSAADENLSGKTDDDFPAITVQYKGDEFPLFSTTSNGFFADMSVLDEPLEKLLAGFRSELENEIAEDDDLVLQVDELGLELAEVKEHSDLYQEVANSVKQSALGELMTNVTFRQVLEIFDLLVKNQDPDSSRTLYTYLFTKPNTEKRLESLIESATAGKGLDEVIHLFESPMPAGTSVLDTGVTIDDVHEELDKFDSPVDEERPGEAKGAEADDEYPEEEHTNADTSALEGQEVDDHEGDSHGEDGHEQDGQYDKEVSAGTETEIPADASIAEANPVAVDETDTVAADEGFEQNARAGSEIDPFANLELDEGVNDDIDLGDSIEAQEGVNVESEAVRGQTNDTSTTTTLQGEEEAASVNVDLGAGSVEVETAEKDNSGENDLDEIDWRDEPEADDDEPSTPSAAGKRSRGDDDDVDAEDEQDAKRRRP
ncbi:hypothetical protein NW762_005029 [Fusarium torreyae]|uniref:Uncharacterized protein n=1 Tax=Fusarium torreyae TaxID=1237075 RepID=A0A9W8VGL8_9HYPO|nr:hypothetical protein NW762_005029 [Fusarium torreyae]